MIKDKTITNKVNKEEFERLKINLLKERIGIGDWLNIVMEDYNKKHGDGNPAYTLDHFNNESFLVTPAYHRPLSVWKSFLLKCPDKEYKEWVSQLESLLSLERKVTNQR